MVVDAVLASCISQQGRKKRKEVERERKEGIRKEKTD
jgi:hypothetical protein